MDDFTTRTMNTRHEAAIAAAAMAWAQARQHRLNAAKAVRAAPLFSRARSAAEGAKTSAKRAETAALRKLATLCAPVTLRGDVREVIDAQALPKF